MGLQAAPSRKERLDPFDFVGRRQHVSCSLEDFEAMRERPACASPTKEDSFCLCDDRGAAATNKFLLQNLLVSRRLPSRPSSARLSHDHSFTVPVKHGSQHVNEKAVAVGRARNPTFPVRFACFTCSQTKGCGVHV